MSPKRPTVRAVDLPVLLQWLDGTNLRLARRAWLVLEEAGGRQERDLVVACGLRRSTVQAVISGYQHSGLLGLVDAPRVGRPKKTNAARALSDAKVGSACTAAAAQGVSKDTIWRYVRLLGSSLDPTTRLSAPLFGTLPFPSVAAIYCDDNVTLIILSGKPIAAQNTRVLGHLHMPKQRCPDAAMTPRLQDWLAALTSLRRRQAVGAPRARHEAAAWFSARAAKLPEALGPCSAILAGDPCSPQFVYWLTVIRKWQSMTPTKWSSAAVEAATSSADWAGLLIARGLDSPKLQALTWPAESTLPVAWSVAINAAGRPTVIPD